MIRYQVRLPDDVKNLIKHLPPSLKQKVRAALDLLEVEPRSGKLLTRELAGLWSYPVAPFRIVYLIEPFRQEVQVIGLGHRRDIYGVILERLYGRQ